MSAAQPTNTDGSPPSLQDLTPFTESWLLGPSSTNFYTRTYAPPSTTPVRALIVFLHGFAEHIARYAHFQTLLAQDGVAVFAFDQRGFGRTAMDVKNKSAGSAYGKTNWKEQENDIQWAVGEAKKKFPDVPTFLMGHSMVGCSCRTKRDWHFFAIRLSLLYRVYFLVRVCADRVAFFWS